MPGIVAIVSQLGHVCLLLDFFYYYYLALKKGGSTMVLPSHGMLDV